MTARKTYSVIAFLLTIIVFGYFTRSTWSQSFSHLKLDADRVIWTDLSFRAKNFFVTVTTDVQLAPSSTTKFESSWLTSPEGDPLRHSSKQLYNVRVNRIIDPIFRSPVKLANQVWFDPNEVTVLHRIRLRRGKDDFIKIYRFSREGVYRLRREPNSKQEALLAPEQWTDVRETFYPYDLSQLGCPHVSESAVLIYVTSAAAISKGNEPLSLCVFGNKQLHHVQLRAEGLHPLTVNYFEKTPQNGVRKEGTVEALRIALDTQPLGTDLEKVRNFSFFGLKRDIAIDIDPTSRIPIQVSGIIPGVGRVELKLREVRMKKRH